MLIDFRLCPGCTDIALVNISNNLEDNFPYISKDALVVADDIRELKPLLKEFKNLNFYRDSTNMIKEVYKVIELPALLLLNENNEIIISFNNILQNNVDYKKIDSVINYKIFTNLNENEDNLIMFASSGSENRDGSKICLFDYLNYRASIFDTKNGRLINEIIINDTIPLIFKNNFTEYEWSRYYSKDPNFGVKIQNCFFGNEDKIILTGFCIGDVKLDTIIETNVNSRLDTIHQASGIPKNFHIKLENNKIIIDSLLNTDYTQLKTNFYHDDILISNIFPSQEQLRNYDSFYLLKFMNLSDKSEKTDIKLNDLKDYKINFREPIEQILQAHSVYNFKDDNLIFLNSYNNIFFIEQNDAIREIEPKGILNDVFKRDQKFDSQSFLDSSRSQNFDKYFVHSITFDENNNFYVIMFYEKETIRDIVIQKYNVDKGFVNEIKIDLNKFDDEISTIAPVSFKSR